MLRNLEPDPDIGDSHIIGPLAFDVIRMAHHGEDRQA